MKVNVLHIKDVAGIGSILSHFQNKYNKGKSDLFYHKKYNFTASISGFYEGKSFKKYRRLLISSLVRSFHYDIIHIHSTEFLIPLFKLLGKKVVLHYHGTDIRDPKNSRDKKKIFYRSMADMIIYNDESLFPKIITFGSVKKRYLPNPVDTDLFKFKENKRFGGLSYISNSLDKEITIKAIKEIMDADIINPTEHSIPYHLMPEKLSKYEIYFDIRIITGKQELDALSTTSLQALSCGCKVYHKGKIIYEFPSEHEPRSVIEKLHNYYCELLY